MDERIETRHPEGKKGVRIHRDKYETIKDFILQTLNQKEALSYLDLNDLAVEQLQNNFDGKVPWYLVTVKLDLEARGLIERIPKTSPHQLRLTQEGKNHV